MGLKSFMVGGLLAANVAADAQTPITEAAIKSAFKTAVEEKRLTQRPYIGINHADKPYDMCMDYDFFVQGHRVTLYYCLDYPDKVIVEWDNFKSWDQANKEALYQNLMSPFPVLK